MSLLKICLIFLFPRKISVTTSFLWLNQMTDNAYCIVNAYRIDIYSKNKHKSTPVTCLALQYVVYNAEFDVTIAYCENLHSASTGWFGYNLHGSSVGLQTMRTYIQYEHKCKWLISLINKENNSQMQPYPTRLNTFHH